MSAENATVGSNYASGECAGKDWQYVLRCCWSCRAITTSSKRWSLFRDCLYQPQHGIRSTACMRCLSRMAARSREVPCPPRSQSQIAMGRTPQQPPKPGHLSSHSKNKLMRACKKHHPNVLRPRIVQVAALPLLYLPAECQEVCRIKLLVRKRISAVIRAAQTRALNGEGDAAPGTEMAGLLRFLWGCERSA